MLLSGLEMHVEMMAHRSVPAHTASRAAARAKIARLSSIGIMTLKELETAGRHALAQLNLELLDARNLDEDRDGKQGDRNSREQTVGAGVGS